MGHYKKLKKEIIKHLCVNIVCGNIATLFSNHVCFSRLIILFNA